MGKGFKILTFLQFNNNLNFIYIYAMHTARNIASKTLSNITQECYFIFMLTLQSKSFGS